MEYRKLRIFKICGLIRISHHYIITNTTIRQKPPKYLCVTLKSIPLSTFFLEGLLMERHKKKKTYFKWIRKWNPCVLILVGLNFCIWIYYLSEMWYMVGKIISIHMHFILHRTFLKIAYLAITHSVNFNNICGLNKLWLPEIA